MPKARVRVEDSDELRGALSLRAARAAMRLDTAAFVLLAIVSVCATIGVVGGLAELAVADDGSARIAWGTVAGASLLGWLFSILPYLAAQAIARYILFRTEDQP